MASYYALNTIFVRFNSVYYFACGAFVERGNLGRLHIHTHAHFWAIILKLKLSRNHRRVISVA